MKFGSVCSGIEAASVAWEPLGWSADWLAEIEPFPSAVLAHHWPEVANLGDMTQLPRKVLARKIRAPDVLVGGTPCQAFSVAGLREGLADERGQLTIKYVEVLNAIDDIRSQGGRQPAVAVWENVPGVLSDKSNAFGCFLGGLAGEDCELQPTGKKWANAGCVYGPQRAVAWRVLDAQYFGLAQRRRRVFVVASARAGFDPAAVLFEREGVRRDTAPSREASTPVAALTANGVGTCGADDNQAQAGHLVETGRWPSDIACTLNAAFGDKLGLEDQHINGGAPLFVPGVTPIQNALRGANQNGLGIAGEGDPMYTLDTASQHGVCITGDRSPALTAEGHANAGGPLAALQGGDVRRLTPVECARLQGFPDYHTQIPWRNKAIEDCPDGPQYKAYGNSMAVPVMRWIGSRIAKELTARPTNNREV